MGTEARGRAVAVAVAIGIPALSGVDPAAETIVVVGPNEGAAYDNAVLLYTAGWLR